MTDFGRENNFHDLGSLKKPFCLNLGIGARTFIGFTTTSGGRLKGTTGNSSRNLVDLTNLLDMFG